jgi:hypothetical protein
MKNGIILLLTATVLLSACESIGDPLDSLEATGTVTGTVFVDRDGNGAFSEGDGALAGIDVQLLTLHGTTVAATARSSATGALAFTAVPVGRYRVSVLSATLPDSLPVAAADSAEVTVNANGGATVTVRATYRQVSTAEARTLPAGSRVFIAGIITNAWPTFGDSTVHVRDHTGSLRNARFDFTSTAVGDSVRILGTVSSRDGQPGLAFGRVFRIRQGEPAAPVAVTTGAAHTAAGGTLDAELVRIEDASIVSVSILLSGERQIVVTDGSTTLRIRHRAALVVALPPADTQTGVIPARLDVTGVLVADGQGAWVLKPRIEADVTVRTNTD